MMIRDIRTSLASALFFCLMVPAASNAAGVKRVWDKAGNVKIKRVYNKDGQLVYEKAWDIKTGNEVPVPAKAGNMVNREAELTQLNSVLIDEVRMLKSQMQGMQEEMAALKMSHTSLYEEQLATKESVDAKIEKKVIEVAKSTNNPEVMWNTALVKQGKCQWSGELRTRFENYQYDNSSTMTNQEFIGQRSRLQLDGSPSENTSFVLRLQDRRNWGDNGLSGTTDNGDNTELNLLYFNVENFLPKTQLRIGRQELCFGDGRLLCNRDWSNQGITFDAVRLTRQFHGKDNMSAWYSKAAEGTTTVTDDTDFGGIWAQFFKKDIEYNLYTMMKRDNATDLEYALYGLHLNGKFHKKWNWQAQYNVQDGELGTSDVEAQMAHARLGYTFNGKNKPKIEGTYTYHSGDSNSTDKKVEGWQNVYGAGHAYLGWIDLIGRRNIEEVSAIFTINPCEKSKFHLSYHDFKLAEKNDNLYNIHMAGTYTRNSAVAASTDVGQEIDFQYVYKYNKNLQLFIGGGVFDADAQYKLLDNAQRFWLGSNYRF